MFYQLFVYILYKFNSFKIGKLKVLNWITNETLWITDKDC